MGAEILDQMVAFFVLTDDEKFLFFRIISHYAELQKKQLQKDFVRYLLESGHITNSDDLQGLEDKEVLIFHPKSWDFAPKAIRKFPILGELTIKKSLASNSRGSTEAQTEPWVLLDNERAQASWDELLFGLIQRKLKSVLGSDALCLDDASIEEFCELYAKDEQFLFAVLGRLCKAHKISCIEGQSKNEDQDSFQFLITLLH